MYLSRLEIQGFKSFAQRVGLAFDSGISAIVGPNGCGKTNIVDAIRWVLGEQRYSALRSDKMEDVIFNGTKARKALGMAEASLVIENTRGILPSEYSQVTIGRRVYRSGESEYLLNRVPCRLKDILDLFMDTGMGADAYSVIELKMIETILSDKTDERRRLFEEAAGVTKYKHRRKAAFRKLEAVQADLVRVNDIVTEVQKAVASLERQARRAEQFNTVKERLRNLEVDLMEREFAQLHARMIPLQEKFTTLSADHSRLTEDLSDDESRLEGLRGEILVMERRLAEAQRDVASQRERIHRVEEKNLVFAERIGGLTEREEAAYLHLQEKQTALRAFEEILDRKKSELQTLNETTIATVTQIAEKQAEQEKKRGQVENLRGRAGHAAEENEAYQAEILRLGGEIAALSADDRQHRRLFTEAEMRYYDAERRKNELQEGATALQRREAEIAAKVERFRAKADFLKGLIESRDGLSDGVRYLASSERWTPRRKMTVADAIHAEDRFRAAIEAALGEYANLLVVQNAAEADEAIALLKEDERGKATFVALDRMPELTTHYRLPDLAGIEGWAADLARFDEEFAPLFRFLLDRVLIVDTAETARALAGTLGGVRCVTLEGEILTGAGLVRGGSRRQDEGGSIGKHKQIEELARHISEGDRQLAELGQARHAILQEQEAIDLKALSDAVKSIEKEMTAVEMRMAQLEFEKRRATDVIARNTENIAGVATEVEVLQAAIALQEPELVRLTERRSDVERAVGAVTQDLGRLEEEWNARSAEVTELGIALVNARNERQNAQADMERTDRSLLAAAEALERAAGEIALALEEIAAAERSVAENASAVAVLAEELRSLDEARAGVQSEAAALRNEAHTRELRIRDRRRSHDESIRLAHECELKIADLRAKSDHLVARAQEEFELALELKSYPEDEFVDFAALRDEIQALRDKLKNLGNINFAAFEEYTTEKQRAEFLAGQRNDLLEAEKTLLATIEEINGTAQRKFLETFALIRKNFVETFKSLFDPGDECDLKLEPDVDPLEAGIEIVAKPRGKRPTSIDLLSGGEKTLTAIALLFAIYLVKPSPFCILDEVDAPLDDANIDRFTRILRKFSSNTQFIVVTHNKRTMEAANALYGVTMEEEGVSKIVTVRFNQQAQVSAAAVATG